MIVRQVENKNNEWNQIKECVHLLNYGETLKANQLIIEKLSEIEENNTEYSEVWASIVEAAGFYPYVVKCEKVLQLKDIQSNITKEYFKSKYINGIYFHEQQKLLVDKIEHGLNMIVSAPTSFGKSLLIEEIIASKMYKEILIIQPTLALLDETRKKMNKYQKNYKILVHSSQIPSEDKGNIYLFTAERVMEFQKFHKIEFFVLDEFYKLSKKRDDERADILNNAFHFVLDKFQCKFMLLGPNIDNISNGFAHKYNAEFFKTEYSLVLNREIDYYSRFDGMFGKSGEKKAFKEEKLFELLVNLQDESTIIFCSSPSKVRKLAKSFLVYLIRKGLNETAEELPLVEWIKRNVSSEWSLAKFLNYNIGIHDGALPKHITSSIIKYYISGKLNYLFCTTTIIEGINTCAKNIIYYDNTKGNRVPIDYFDYCNIRGRAGRLMVHYIGNIYNFNKPPEQEMTIVDIPFYEQENVSDEILINLEEYEMKHPEKEQNQYILNLPQDIRKLFQKNGVSVRGQERILDELLKEENYNKISWTGKPTYEQLTFIIVMAWNNLLRPGETTSPMTIKKLVKLTFDYGNGKTINQLISDDYEYRLKNQGNIDMQTKISILDESVQTIFQTVRHWFQYKVPKWLGVLNSLQEYANLEKGRRAGSYVYYANIIENDSVPDNVALLMEFNIPSSTIKKVLNLLPNDLSDQELVDYIFKNNID